MEISVGKIDSGAQLDKLSQYENEKEVLFPPLSNLEAVGDSRIEMIGGDRILVVPIKINLNLKGRTIQERVESRKLQAVEMARKCMMEVKSEFARYNEDTQGEHTYEDCFLELQILEARMVERDPEWFNYDNNFKECWNDVLLVKNRSMADRFGKLWMEDLQDDNRPTLEFWEKLQNLRDRFTKDIVREVAIKEISASNAEHKHDTEGWMFVWEALLDDLNVLINRCGNLLMNPLMTTNMSYLSAFSLCAVKGSVRGLRLHFAAGFDGKEELDEADPIYGNSVLHWACYCGKEKCVKELIAAKADIHLKNKVDFLAY